MDEGEWGKRMVDPTAWPTMANGVFADQQGWNLGRRILQFLLTSLTVSRKMSAF
jgi:hypothetical protein